MDKQELQQSVVDFEKSRNQLMNISAQKQQLQIQSATLETGLKELEKTKEKKAFKAAGSILIACDVEELKKELAEQKESADLRVKTLQKQEDSIVEKLNKLKSKIEAGAAELQGASPESQMTGEETKIIQSKEKGKK